MISQHCESMTGISSRVDLDRGTGKIHNLRQSCAVPHVGNTDYNIFLNTVEETAEAPLNKMQSSQASVDGTVLMQTELSLHCLVFSTCCCSQAGQGCLYRHLGHCFKCQRNITLLYDPDSSRETCRTWRMLEYLYG